MNKKHRIFIAINLPQDIKKFLSKYQKKWSRPTINRDRGSSISSGPELNAKWVNEDNLHITLVFLGYLTDEEIGEVCMITKKVAQRHNSFNLTLNKISYGPIDKVPPRMIWVNGESSKELLSIKKDLEDSLLEKINFVPEKRSFNFHITLARFNAFQWRTIEPEERPEIDENIDLTFTVESIEVMESKLKRSGPEYTIIESSSLLS